MEGLRLAESGLVRCAEVVLHRQHVDVALFPGRIGDLGDDGFQALAIGGIAVEQADRVEAETEIARMRQQADRAGGALTALSRHFIAHAIRQRLRRVAEMVGAPPPGQVGTPGRPQPAAGEHLIEFVQIQPEQKQAVTEGVRARCQATMPDPADVERALHAQATSRRTGAV